MKDRSRSAIVGCRVTPDARRKLEEIAKKDGVSLSKLASDYIMAFSGATEREIDLFLAKNKQQNAEIDTLRGEIKAARAQVKESTAELAELESRYEDAKKFYTSVEEQISAYMAGKVKMIDIAG